MGLTLSEVEDKTRINRRFLTALESGEYHALPTPVHVRGFLRNYARFLNLDPDPLLDRYDQIREQMPEDLQATQQTATPFIPDPPLLRESQPFFDPVNFQLDEGRRRDPQSIVRILIILALVAFLALVVNRFFPLLTGGEDGTLSLTEGINQAWQDLLNSGELDADTPEPGTDALPSLPAAENTLNTGSNNSGAANTTPLPTRPTLGTLEIINIRLDISERTWMEVSIDGDIRFSGFATRGDVFEWTALTSVRLLTGNAHGIIATINDIELGRLGGFQEAREENWSTTQ